ncbi:MAG: hypothetical protein GXP52_05455, partial [Deltaproteobacteria bacterium]|nr:hypothetical protein [Deltaproteobacteria bacterium]
ERLFGHSRINLMAGVLEGKVHRIGFFHPRTGGLSKLLEKIHGYYGTTSGEQEEWTVWEDERTNLELLSREDGANLTLMDKDENEVL